MIGPREVYLGMVKPVVDKVLALIDVRLKQFAA